MAISGGLTEFTDVKQGTKQVLKVMQGPLEVWSSYTPYMYLSNATGDNKIWVLSLEDFSTVQLVTQTGPYIGQDKVLLVDPVNKTVWRFGYTSGAMNMYNMSDLVTPVTSYVDTSVRMPDWGNLAGDRVVGEYVTTSPGSFLRLLNAQTGAFVYLNSRPSYQVSYGLSHTYGGNVYGSKYNTYYNDSMNSVETNVFTWAIGTFGTYPKPFYVADNVIIGNYYSNGVYKAVRTDLVSKAQVELYSGSLLTAIGYKDGWLYYINYQGIVRKVDALTGNNDTLLFDLVDTIDVFNGDTRMLPHTDYFYFYSTSTNLMSKVNLDTGTVVLTFNRLTLTGSSNGRGFDVG